MPLPNRQTYKERAYETEGTDTVKVPKWEQTCHVQEMKEGQYDWYPASKDENGTRLAWRSR